MASDCAPPASLRPPSSPGLLDSLAPGVLFAAVFAAGIVGVETFLAYFTGSYFAWHVTGMVALFWMTVGAAGAVGLAILCLPLVALAKGRLRHAIVPSAVIAAGSFLNSIVIRDNFAGRDSLGASLFFNTYFLVCWSLVVGAFNCLLIAQARNVRRWSVTFLAVLSVLFASAGAFFVWRTSAAFTVVIAPLAILALGVLAVDSLARPAKRAALLSAIAAACVLALLVIGNSVGLRPSVPVDVQLGPDPSRAAMLAGRPNVIIVVLDTLRADHTSLCGYRYRTTPALDKLAADCRLFPFGESVDSWTLPPHASLFTGKYPRQHGAHAVSFSTVEGIEKYPTCSIPLAPSQRTLATCLSERGYNTAAIVANYTWLCRQFGLDQGFDYYYDLPRHLIFLQNGAPLYRYGMEAIDRLLGKNGKFVQTYWDAGTVTRMAQSWIRKNKDAPFFLFLNYMDPHYPYSAVPPFDKINGDIPYDMALRMRPFQDLISRYINTGTGLSPELLGRLVNQYDGEIAYTDHCVGKLVDTLRAEGLYSDTLLVVTSDHGEFLGEHRLLNHGVGIYEGGTRIPILVKYPNEKYAGQVMNERVSIIDIFATVFQVLQFPLPKDVSAVPLGSPPRPIYIEDFENGMNVRRYGKRFKCTRTAICDGNYKYISSTAGQSELYSLSEDPAEMCDLAQSLDKVKAELDSKLKYWQGTTPLFDGAKEISRGPSREEMLRLKSVGYLFGN